MKIKLLVIFVLISIFSVAGVFYAKNYFFYTAQVEKVDGDQIHVDQVIDLIVKNKDKLKDYSGQTFQIDPALISKSNISESNKLNELNINGIKPNKIILHFWASWCDPCINEIPDLLWYLKNHQDEIASGKLKIFLINLDYELRPLQNFLKSFPDLNSKLYYQIWDTEEVIQKTFVIDRLPATIMIYSDKKSEKFQTVVNWKQMP